MNKEITLLNQYLNDEIELKSYEISLLIKKIEDNTQETNLLIAKCYQRIGRFSLAAAHYEIVIKESKTITQSTFYNLLTSKNYYVDDDCKEILEIVKNNNMLPLEEIEKTYNQVMNHRRSLKHDPIEMSKDYLDVIDEIEERIDKNRTIFGLGACHEIWNLKTIYLLEKGINWKSPSVLNPRVMFD